MNELRRSRFQDRLLQIPEEIDLFVGGGRGGGKSYGLALLALRHAAQYGMQARMLYLRKTYKGLADFELVTRELFGLVFEGEAKYNASEHVWRLPGGAYLELGQLDSHADFAKYQGRSFTLLLVDEAGQYAIPDLIDMMRSNLRGGRDVAIRTAIAANPAGVGHHWIARRYVFRAAPWSIFVDEKSKRQWISCPSTFLDNEFIDRDQYRGQLDGACPDDPELLRAWLEGDWTVARGAFFASCLEESRVAVGPFKTVPSKELGWSTWIAHDFGSSAPSVTYLIARSPGAEFEGKYYPRDSLVVIDELAAVRKDNLNMGLGWTAATTAEAIREWCAKWSVPPAGVADDACFAKGGLSSGSIADEFARGGVRFEPAQKADRITGWQLMRRLLSDAGKPDRPGLYVSRSCEYFWATVPTLARDQKRVEDVDSSGPDHGADAMRYGLRRQEWATTIDIRFARIG